MTKTMVQLQFGSEPCISQQSTCTTTYQVTTCVKQSIWSHKQATCSGKNFEEIIFVVEVKSTKTVKFIVLENFLLYGTNHFVHRKCTVAAVHNLSVQVLHTIGNVWGNSREAITPLFTAGLKLFYFNDSSIWRASWWYTICSYKMYTTQVVKGKLGLRWMRTEFSSCND